MTNKNLSVIIIFLIAISCQEVKTTDKDNTADQKVDIEQEKIVKWIK